MMPLPDYAAGMKLELTSDAADGTVTDNVVSFNVAPTGYELSCDWAGKPVTEGFGHSHVLLDGALVDMECTPVDMECTPEASVSMQNVQPGEHAIAVLPAINDHAEVHDNEVEFAFTYFPTSPLPEIVDAASTGTPTIKIISPKPGDVVSGESDVVVEVTNYELNCDLHGKPGLFGIGHYHVNLDSTTGPMMGMGTMLGMGCTTTFTASTEGLATGETHTVIALLADNGHAPLMPAVEGAVDVTVGWSDQCASEWVRSRCSPPRVRLIRMTRRVQMPVRLPGTSCPTPVRRGSPISTTAAARSGRRTRSTPSPHTRSSPTSTGQPAPAAQRARRHPTRRVRSALLRSKPDPTSSPNTHPDLMQKTGRFRQL